MLTEIKKERKICNGLEGSNTKFLNKTKVACIGDIEVNAKYVTRMNNKKYPKYSNQRGVSLSGSYIAIFTLGEVKSWIKFLTLKLNFVLTSI